MGENKIKAAVIDDDRYTVQAIKKCLEKLELLDRIDSFTDPILALENIEQTQYELIITDNTMPVIDGIELAERVLEIYKPVLILVSVVCNQVKTKFNGEELFDYIYQKPLDYEEFTMEIAEIIKALEQAEITPKIDIKDKLLVDQIINTLSHEENEYIYEKLSEELYKDESIIRRRLNRISGSEKPLDFILRIIKKKQSKKAGEASK
ncbi:MAG: response regulator [Clostridia bacterium]|nr:response regulator [Clostridia bacterium]